MSDLRQDLDGEGCVAAREFLAAEDVRSARDWLEGVESAGAGIAASYQPEFEEPGPDRKVTVRKLRRLFWNDRPFWKDYLRRTGIAALAQSLITAPVLIFHAAFMKRRQVGSAVGFHQDQALWDRDHPGAVTMWFALDDARPENGAVVGYPGSQRRGLIPHGRSVNHAWHPVIDVDAAQLGPSSDLSAATGDCIVWDRWFVHGSGPNCSGEDRRGMVFVFASSAHGPVIEPDRYPIMAGGGG